MAGGEINVSSSVGNQEFSGLEVGLYTNNECLSVPVESVLEEPVVSGAEASVWLNKLEGNGISFEGDELFGQPLVMGLSGGATGLDPDKCRILLLASLTSLGTNVWTVSIIHQFAQGDYRNPMSTWLFPIEVAVEAHIIYARFSDRWWRWPNLPPQYRLETGVSEWFNHRRTWIPGGSLWNIKEAWEECGRPGGGLPKKVKDWVAAHLPQPVMLPEPAPVPVASMVAATAGATLLVIGAKQAASLLGALQSGGVFVLEGTAMVGSSVFAPIILLPDETFSSDGDSL